MRGDGIENANEKIGNGFGTGYLMNNGYLNLL